jgi:hypothetical protein
MHGSVVRASQTWHRVVINEFERTQIEEIRTEILEEFK